MKKIYRYVDSDARWILRASDYESKMARYRLIVMGMAHWRQKMLGIALYVRSGAYIYDWMP